MVERDPQLRKSSQARATTKLPKQDVLPFRQNGGRREGAGRKPNGPQAMVSHGLRTALAARFPAHVTMKLRRGLPRLRSRPEYAALRAAFRAAATDVASA